MAQGYDPLPLPTQAPDLEPFHTCQFGDEWLQFVLGAVEQQCLRQGVWSEGGEVQYTIPEEVHQLLLQLQTEVQPMLPVDNYLIHAWNWRKVSGEWQSGYTSSANDGVFVWNSTNSVGDSADMPIGIRAGDYEAKIGYWASANSAAIRLQFEHTTLPTVPFALILTHLGTPGYNNLAPALFTLSDDYDPDNTRLVLDVVSGGAGGVCTIQNIAIVRV